MKYTPTDVAALPLTSAPSRRPTAGMPPVWVIGAEPEL
jgi:hypothetical protein